MQEQGPEWAAISLEQLHELRERAQLLLGDAYATATMYDINLHLIRPTCEQEAEAYARVVNRGNLRKVQVFISHAWAENFDEFVNSVTAAFECWPVKPNIWICALALLQSSDPKVVEKQVGLSTDPRKAPFSRALAMSQKLLVVRNRAVDLYTRVWCCWEFAMALELGFMNEVGMVMVAGPATFADAGAVDVAQACASNPADKEKILRHLLVNGTYKETNEKLTLIRQHISDAA